MRSVICFILAIAFAVVAINFYNQSTQELDKKSASVLGIDSVMNLQATIYAGIAGIISILCLIAALILSELGDVSTELKLHKSGQKEPVPYYPPQQDIPYTPSEQTYQQSASVRQDMPVKPKQQVSHSAWSKNDQQEDNDYRANWRRKQKNNL